MVITLKGNFSLITRITLRLHLSITLSHFYLQPLICVHTYSLMQTRNNCVLNFVFALGPCSRLWSSVVWLNNILRSSSCSHFRSSVGDLSWPLPLLLANIFLYWLARGTCYILLLLVLPGSLVGALLSARSRSVPFRVADGAIPLAPSSWVRVVSFPCSLLLLCLISSVWAPWPKVTQQRQIYTLTLRQAYDVIRGNLTGLCFSHTQVTHKIVSALR